jgi:ABC-type lipoprotein export system ATPase subunit
VTTLHAAIEIEGLRLASEELGVDGLTVVVHPGESVALVGRRQRLLTAIVRAVGGLDPVLGGRIRVGGVDVGRATRSELHRLRRDVGYVSVGGGLFANMTLRTNLELPLLYRGVPPEAARRRGEDLLERARLSELADVRAAELSVEQQKVAAYARALAADPQIVLAEDPAAHLHPEGRDVVEALHRGLRARGATVLVADDDEELAHRLADRVLDVDEAASPPRTGATVAPSPTAEVDA